VVPQTEFEHARNRLHVKAVPDTLPCREDEFMEIQEHLESAIEEGTGSCICEFNVNLLTVAFWFHRTLTVVHIRY